MNLLDELLSESDARTLRQFLITTFAGLGADAADRILKESDFGTRKSPNKLSKDERQSLHHAMRNVNISEGQTMQVMRYANRVPLQFKQRDCAITEAVMNTNWRSYGLSQSRGSLPSGPVSVIVHIASVWVPFTSESKEAIAAYPEIQKGVATGASVRGTQVGYVLAAAETSQAGGRTKKRLPPLPGRSGSGGQRDQRCQSRRSCISNSYMSPSERQRKRTPRFDDRGRRVFRMKTLSTTATTC
jgi:DNA topoisomerase VI subunit B